MPNYLITIKQHSITVQKTNKPKGVIFGKAIIMLVSQYATLRDFKIEDDLPITNTPVSVLANLVRGVNNKSLQNILPRVGLETLLNQRPKEDLYCPLRRLTLYSIFGLAIDSDVDNITTDIASPFMSRRSLTMLEALPPLHNAVEIEEDLVNKQIGIITDEYYSLVRIHQFSGVISNMLPNYNKILSSSLDGAEELKHNLLLESAMVLLNGQVTDFVVISRQGQKTVEALLFGDFEEYLKDVPNKKSI